MPLLTDPKKIKELAEEREDENWEFRTFLKSCNSDEINATVHDLYREIASQIDCTTCGNCCREAVPVLDQEDIEKFAAGLRMSTEAFRKQFLMVDKDGDTIFNKLPCPFLKDNKCSNYTHRPKNCISYPHLYKDRIVSRLIGLVERCSVCPIVFHVYERLKDRFWFCVDDME